MKILYRNKDVFDSAVAFEDDNGELHLYNPVPEDIEKILDEYEERENTEAE